MAVSERINEDSLLVNLTELDSRLAELDATNASDRRIVLRAIERLVEEYIVPAGDCTLSPNGLELYDLDSAAGTEISGLLLGVFGNKMSGLQRPSDEELNSALQFIGLELRDAAQRDKFYRCWAANTADGTIGGLVNFLKQPVLTGQTANIQTDEEAAAIHRLLDNNLPEKLDYTLRTFVERLEKTAA
jgi:hypothetical protein